MGPGSCPGQVGVRSILAPESTACAGSHVLPPTPKQGGGYRVDGTLAPFRRGGNAIIELGMKFYASSSDNNSIIKCSLSTTNNRGWGHCGGTQHRHDIFLLNLTHPAPLLVSPTALEAYCGGTQHRNNDFLLDLMHPAPLLVSPTALEAYSSTVSWRFVVCRVSSG
jgi:hypothetical protein